MHGCLRGRHWAADRDARDMLYVAANAMMMRSVASSKIQSWGLRRMRRKGRRRAPIAVGRKLAVIMHHECGRNDAVFEAFNALY